MQQNELIWERRQRLDIIKLLKTKIKNKIYKALISTNVNSLNDLIPIIKKEVNKILLKNNIDVIDEKELDEYAIQTLLSVFGLDKIAYLIIDRDVNEIYVDGAQKPIYIDHKNRGRLITNIKLNQEEINRLLLFLKYFTNLFVSKTKPSDKVEMELGGIKLRISVDIPPLVNDYSFVIRKQHENDFNIYNVLKANQVEVLLLLYLAALMKMNILILGEPGSGKTFLASSILNVLPSYWRLLLIEDAREININRDFAFVRYKANPFESRINDEFSKEKQILKALHRSPDYVFIGEIHDKVDAEAYFHGLSSGLKILATSHASSLNEFIDRIKNSFKLDISRICLIDMIVFMKKYITTNISKRFINEIYLSNFVLNGWRGANSNIESNRIPVSLDNKTPTCTHICVFKRGEVVPKKEEYINLLLSIIKNKRKLMNEIFLKEKIQSLFSVLLKITENNKSKELNAKLLLQIRNILESIHEDIIKITL